MHSAFEDMLDTFAKLDIPNNPNILTIKALYIKLLNAGFEPSMAVHVVGNMHIDVDKYFIEKYLDKATTVYADLIVKIRAECDKISPALFGKHIEANPLTLTYNL